MCQACDCCWARSRRQPVIDVIVAAALTWAAHSSVAVVLLIMSFAAKGVVPPQAAYRPGSRCQSRHRLEPAVRSSARPAIRRPKRLPIGNLLNRCDRVRPRAGAARSGSGRRLVSLDPNADRAVADFHTVFNLAMAALFFPMLRPLGRLLSVAVAGSCRPGRSVAAGLSRRSDAREIPAIALTGSSARGAAHGRCSRSYAGRGT